MQFTQSTQLLQSTNSPNYSIPPISPTCPIQQVHPYNPIHAILTSCPINPIHLVHPMQLIHPIHPIYPINLIHPILPIHPTDLHLYILPIYISVQDSMKIIKLVFEPDCTCFMDLWSHWLHLFEPCQFFIIICVLKMFVWFFFLQFCVK